MGVNISYLFKHSISTREINTIAFCIYSEATMRQAEASAKMHGNSLYCPQDEPGSSQYDCEVWANIKKYKPLENGAT
jgi:hypothetical protein